MIDLRQRTGVGDGIVPASGAKEPQVYSKYVARMRLSNQLLWLRKSKKLERIEIANEIGVTANYWGKVETGSRLPLEKNLLKAFKVLEVSASEEADLFKNWEIANRDWWFAGLARVIKNDSLHLCYFDALDCMVEASVIRECQSAIIPFAMQTPEYVQAIIHEHGRSPRSRAEVAERIKLRLTLQQILWQREDLLIELVICEHAILQMIAGERAAIDQLAHMMKLIEEYGGRLSLRIVQLTPRRSMDRQVPAVVLPTNPVLIFDFHDESVPSAAVRDTEGLNRFTVDRDEVAEDYFAYEGQRDNALPRQESFELIRSNMLRLQASRTIFV